MSVSIVQCRFCGMPFHTLGGIVCQVCQDRINEHFYVIRDYLYDHEECNNLKTLSEATEVPEKEILYLIEQKRLIIAQPLQGAFRCRICKKDIMLGDLCDDCRSSLAATIKTASEEGQKARAGDKEPAARKSEVKKGGKWRSSR